MFCSVVRVSFLNKTRGWLGYPDTDGDISLGNSSYSVTIKNPAVNLPDCYDSTDPWKGAYKTMFVLPQDYSQFRVYFTVEVDGVERPEECAYFYPYNSGNPCCLYLLDVQFKSW